MKKELIVFGIPTADGNVSAGVFQFVRVLEKEGLRNKNVPWEFETILLKGFKPVEYARNRIVQRFLEIPEASRLWFLDADIEPPKEAADLLSVQSDIVSGIYPTWQASGPNRPPMVRWCVYDRASDGRYAHKDVGDRTDVVYAGAAATGCMLIRRKVLEDPRMEGERAYYDVLAGENRYLHDDGGAPPPIFGWHYLPNGLTMCSEDMDFCHRATDNGYSIRVHLGVRCGHNKTVNLMDVERYGKSVAEALRAVA